MAILTKPKLFSQERFDLEDLNLLLSSFSADSRAQTKQFWGNGAFILKGFEVTSLGTPSPAQVAIANGTLINANSADFSWFVGPVGASAQAVALVANSRNYLELEIESVDGTPLPRAFWDPTANNGLGAEFTQTVNTATELEVNVVVLTTGFSGASNRIKLAIIDTDSGNNIVSILDRRELFFRLGTASNSQNNYAWASQAEPTTTIVLTGGAGTYVVGETVTFSGGATAKVTVGGTTTIQVINFSGDNFAIGNTLVGGTSGASRTVSTVSDNFSGADKSIGDLKNLISAIETEIKAIKGTDFWFSPRPATLHDLQEDRSAFLRSNNTVTWTGSQLQFTTDIVLDILNTKLGVSTAHTILVANSPISLANGEMAYVVVNRNSISENVTPVVATNAPAVAAPNTAVYVLFKRQDVSSAGYLHIPLHKQVLSPGQSVRLGASGGGASSGGGDGDDMLSLLYKASFRDDFAEIPTVSSPVDVNSGFTDANTYDTVAQYFRLSYDATKTVTGTGTAMTISGTPTFTVKAGDMLRVGSEARKITVVTSQVLYTLESAFSIDPSASACTISQAVHTVDLNNYAGDGQAIAALLTDNVASVLLTYDDTATLGDVVFDDDPDPVNIAYTASGNGTNFSFVTQRPTALQSQNVVLQLPVAGTQLRIRFFSSKTSGSGQVNLLGYKAFFHRQDLADAQGPVLQQSFCFTDGVGTEVNCQPPTVFSGKTRIQLGFSYTAGVNPGKPNGQLEVYINGAKIPRFIDSTLTPDASYTEVSANTIDLDSDYSALNYSVEVRKPVSLMDSTSIVATQTIRAMYDAIVGSVADVVSGVAQYSSIQAAINGVVSGARILVLNGTYTEALSIGKAITLEGKGHSTEINGTVTMTSASSFCILKGFRILDNVTIQSGSNAGFFVENWLASGKSVSDLGVGNYIAYIQE